MHLKPVSENKGSCDGREEGLIATELFMKIFYKIVLYNYFSKKNFENVSKLHFHFSVLFKESNLSNDRYFKSEYLNGLKSFR